MPDASPPPALRHGMSVDVEDWFQVQAFAGVIADGVVAVGEPDVVHRAGLAHLGVERVEVGPVPGLAAVPGRVDQSRLAEDAEVLGDRLSGHREVARQLGGGHRPGGGDELQDPTPGRVGQRPEHGVGAAHTGQRRRR